MATITANHYPDTASYANFDAYASEISDAFAAFGWVQGNDPGQVVWDASSVPISAVAVGATAVYTYDATSATGPVLRRGMSVAITGFSTGGNNVTATITALGGSGASSTFTVALTTQVNETHAATGATTALAATPSSGSPAYEVWTSSDASSSTCPITVKIEYWGSSNIPNFAFSVGTNGTDGSGNLLAPKSIRFTLACYQPDNASLYPCYFSGDSGSFRMYIFNNGGTAYPDNYQPIGFAVSRNYNTSGVIQADYVQVLVLGNSGSSNKIQQQCIFNASNGGVTPWDSSNFLAALPGGAGASGAYGANVIVSPCFPSIGALGNPNINHFTSRVNDFSNGTSFSMSVYGSAHNYIVMNQNITGYGPGGLTASFIMRWE